jgi:hypothetical protein
MDRDNKGIDDKWFNRDLADRIQLPGILQAQGYGDEISVDTPWVAVLGVAGWSKKPEYQPYTKPGNVKVPFLSQPPRHYLGVAWYQRDIDVPPAWQGQRVHLLLERARWDVRVWVDDQQLGETNGLCAPDEFELGTLAPGKHRLSIRANNSMADMNATGLVYRPDGHSVSDALGAAWNGIAGRIELNATSPVWIDDAQVFPNIEKKTALIKAQIGNITGQPGSGTLTCGTTTVPVTWDAKGGHAELEVPVADKPWDEFHPTLQNLTVILKGAQAGDHREITFGLREIKANGKQLLLNGREINLRFTHSGGDFPLTGYPATDVESWKKIIQVCKDYGLNGIRFHSWCPPDAAFTAADEMGFYIQPECGMWSNFSPAPMGAMLEAETQRIMKAYGNHPSFILLSPSNEPAGNWQRVLEPWTARWFELDPRRLYAANTGRSSPNEKGPTYAISPIRGNRGWFGKDYAGSVQNWSIPVLGHEVGQWCAYPDFDVIKKFTGYLQPGNYEIFRDSAAEHGVLERNHEFAFASGKFQVTCYKEECEANLRTPGLSGYQLLDLHDYLGQGTALIGVVDAFWGPKSYVTAEQFRRFSGQTVPLARMTEHVYRSSDPFNVDVEIAHYGADPIANASPVWRFVDLNGKVVSQGTLATRDIPIGKNIPLGKVTADLSGITAPAEYKLVVGLAGTSFENDWTFWLYPKDLDTTAPADVLVTNVWSEAKVKLAAGGKVLFTPKAADLGDNSPPLSNLPIFWDRPMNPQRTAMLGLWVDAKDPALANFPTEGFCDLQWTDLVRNMRAINIEKAPPQLRPIVQAIDDWNRNYKLGVVFEAKVGPGRLLVCAIDIAGDPATHTVARQLRRSLLDYMATDKFDPQVTLDSAQSDALWPGPSARPAPATAPAPGVQPGDVNEGPNVAPRVR